MQIAAVVVLLLVVVVVVVVVAVVVAVVDSIMPHEIMLGCRCDEVCPEVC